MARRSNHATNAALLTCIKCGRVVKNALDISLGACIGCQKSKKFRPTYEDKKNRQQRERTWNGDKRTEPPPPTGE